MTHVEFTVGQDTAVNSETLCDYGFYEFVLLNHVLTTSKTKGRRLDPWLVLIDSEATTDIFCNPEMMINIIRMNWNFIVYCNAGLKATIMKGKPQGYIYV